MPDRSDFITPPRKTNLRLTSSDSRVSLTSSSDDGDAERKIRETARNTFAGPIYYSWLARFHRESQALNYLEVGIASGASLARIPVSTNAIGIDPAFNIQNTIQAPVRLFRETSDDFFENHKPEELFGGKIDLSFVDGLHTFDQTFRDIVNVGKYCHDTSIILVHDVAPVHEVVARRERVTNFWTGDVWKIGWMIKELLPKTEIWTIPTYPSGLMVLKNIAADDQPHKIDPDAWKALEADVMARPFPRTGQELAEIINLKPAPEEELFAWALGR